MEAHRELGFRLSSGIHSAKSRCRAAVQLRSPMLATAYSAGLALCRRPDTKTGAELLADVRESVALFGPGWQEIDELAHHRRDDRRIYEQGTGEHLCQSHTGVLNIRHDTNVISNWPESPTGISRLYVQGTGGGD